MQTQSSARQSCQHLAARPTGHCESSGSDLPAIWSRSSLLLAVKRSKVHNSFLTFCRASADAPILAQQCAQQNWSSSSTTPLADALELRTPRATKASKRFTGPGCESWCHSCSFASTAFKSASSASNRRSSCSMARAVSSWQRLTRKLLQARPAGDIVVQRVGILRRNEAQQSADDDHLQHLSEPRIVFEVFAFLVLKAAHRAIGVGNNQQRCTV